MEWFYKCAYFILSHARWTICYSRSCISTRFLYFGHMNVGERCWKQYFLILFVTNINFQLMVWVHLYPFHWFKQSFLVRHIQVSTSCLTSRWHQFGVIKLRHFYSNCLLQVFVFWQNFIIRARRFVRSFSVECKPFFKAKALFAMRFQLIRSRFVRERLNWLFSISPK